MFLALAASTRIITQTQPAATTLITIGQVLNGMGTSIAMSLPSAVSETWFPVSERTTATAISLMSAAAGSGVSFLLGPYMVSMPVMNGTIVLRNETDIPSLKQEMRNLHYTIFGVASAMFVATALYMPAKPRTAPSKSAALARYSFKDGLFQLIKTPTMWFIGCLYAIPMGTYGSWSSVLFPIIAELGFTQKEVGWIGFYGNIAGIVAALIVGRISDIFTRKQKMLLLMLDSCAVICFIWLACMSDDILPRSKELIYTAAITGSMFIGATGPLFLEITCEISYPIAEGISAGFLACILNFAATVYLLITVFPDIELLAMNWVVCGVIGVAIPLLFTTKVNYQRVDIDTQTTPSTSTYMTMEK